MSRAVIYRIILMLQWTACKEQTQQSLVLATTGGYLLQSSAIDQCLLKKSNFNILQKLETGKLT
jgi:hypothetical protein